MSLLLLLGLLQAAPVGDGGVDGATRPLLPDLDQMLRATARDLNRQGVRHGERGQIRKAIRAFQQARDLTPRDSEIINNLGYALFLDGHYTRAIKAYRRAIKLSPRRGVAHENLAEALMRADASKAELTEAREALMRARSFGRPKARLSLLLARLAVRRGRIREAEQAYATRVKLAEPDDALALELGDFFRDHGKRERALYWYRRISTGEALQTAVKRIRDLEIESLVRRHGWVRSRGEVPQRARDLVERGRAALGQGDVDEAIRMLKEATGLAPHHSEAHAALGDARARGDEPKAAELSYLRALAMAPGDETLLARLADFYAEQERAAEATVFFARALDQRPDWTELYLRQARAYRAAGDPKAAYAHVRTYLDRRSEDAPEEAARALLETLRADLPEMPAEPKPTPEARPKPRIQAIRRAQALASRGDFEAALATLRALPDTERGAPVVLNVEATLLLRAGRLEEAAGLFERSLERRGEQPAVLERLAALRLDQGRTEAARAVLLRAETQGAVEAPYQLARIDARRSDSAWPGWLQDAARLATLSSAVSRLEAYQARSGALRHRTEAASLEAELRTRVRTVYVAGGGGLGLLFSGLLFFLLRVWGGQDLGALVRAHPEAGPEVQRVLSAIRHEVLKHNTMVVTGLVAALEAGEEVGDKAAWCRRSLLGDVTTAPGDSARERLRGYAEQLAGIGRTYRARLNLRRRDPALSALLKGFRALERVAPLLDRADALGRRGQAQLIAALQEASQLLNVEGYEAVRALLDDLRMLEVDEALLRNFYDRTRHEPAFDGLTTAELELDCAIPLPCRVAIPRHAFEDVVINLLRNALQSSARHSDVEAPIRLGMGVDEEVDFITGLESVVFLIRDASPQTLTPEMLRGRYIEEGLGLTADLVSRYEGSLDVIEQPAPWKKAVVVKLPRVDEEEA